MAMTRAQSHRGPDDEGIEQVSARPEFPLRPLVVFGHRRLSILDLSSAGHQPMLDPITSNWITYNGEIYNFEELKSDLIQSGHRFVSRCDTEVILKAYAEWGVDSWRRMRGIFAFALWDERFQELHLVRDQLGVKPLYYSETERGLAFASEVRALLAGDWVERRISVDGLCSYLKYGSVQEPYTLVDGILSIPPGHYRTYTANGGSTLLRYWSLNECIYRTWPVPTENVDVLGGLRESIRGQLISDVPVGVFLSGGLDSTAVAAVASQLQPGNIRTFCIGSDDPEFDESVAASQTAKFLGCKHTSLVLEGRMVRDSWEDCLNSYDQPSADGLNTFFVSLLVRQAGIKVAISGLGGDELFVGYSGFEKALRVDHIGGMFAPLPQNLRIRTAEVLARLTPPGSSIASVLTEVLQSNLASSYFASRTLFSWPHILKLLALKSTDQRDQSLWRKRESDLNESAKSMASIDRISYFELQTYMLSTLLRDSDQMSMAVGLELRVPLIDHKLVERVFPVGEIAKIGQEGNKQLLFDALRAILPVDMLRRRKMGFNLPLRKWLMEDLEVSMAAIFNSRQVSGPWERKVFQCVWQNFRTGKVSWSRAFSLFILERWLQKNRISS